MNDCFIDIKDVHLLYPSTLYNTKSLKQTVFEFLKLQKAEKVLPDVYALRGLSMHVKEGERVGIIGSNGAGKSTLLKTMAGIYPISRGNITIKGRVRSLFDLSLGFEVEATGRENIMYRGLLLGETPASIREKTEEIIEFAELGDFIDYPIKTYSAGMYVRLAFAISTMIEGDILLLDEVLGVGDARFMMKAKRRITSLIESAKILVFVSHDHASIKEICNRVIWIDKGVVRMDGDASDVIDKYMEVYVG